MHRPRKPHEVLSRVRIPREELRRQQRPFALIARLARRHEIARLMAPAATQRDHMIQCGILEDKRGPAIDTSTSTIPNGCSLDLALVLLVKHEASVAG
jgi:hypothetical protein